MLTLLLSPVTYLDFPFPPGVNLYPSHEHVHQYHLTFADHFDLHPYILLRHNVTAATWVGDNTTGHWNLRIHREAPPSARILEQTTVSERSFDHLVVASGHFRYPNLPQWEGQDEWLENTPPGTPKREIIHSIFWRDSLKYKGRNLLVVGGGSSGRDVVSNVAPVAKTVRARSPLCIVRPCTDCVYLERCSIL
jgi:cation diffusion facilitator CzcD-associated flavoprotein CzcO